MLKDNYVEQFVDVKTPNIFFVRLGFSVFLLSFGIFSIPYSIILALAFITMGMVFFNLVKDERKVEYDYIMTNANVEVAVVYNKRKRKELRGFDLDQVSLVVPGTSVRFDGDKEIKRYNYTSGYGNSDTIFILVEETGKKLLFELEPNEDVMAHIKSYTKNKMSEF
ncbi:MAG: DUF6106 family protein [Lachnospiraceae bacterium]